MSQTTEIQIQNQAGLPFRQKMNLMLSALNTCFAGTTEPTVTEAYMNWLDTSVTPNVLKRRNAGDTAFETHPLQSLADATKIIADAAMPKAGGNFTGAANANKGADIASAATTDLGAATGEYVRVTGTTTITALGTAQAGTQREVTFASALTLTHNATSLILPTSTNITTAAGDCASFRSEGGGNWRCVKYQRADGSSLASDVTNQRMLLTASVNTTGGTSVDFTGIPSWANIVTVSFNGLSTNGTSLPQIQLGTSSGIENSGYLGSTDALTSTGNAAALFTTGVSIGRAGTSTVAAMRRGMAKFVRLTGDTWVASVMFGQSDAAIIGLAGGSKALVGVLDRVRITTVNGTDTFDSGVASILIEGYQ